jgi:crotonobetainyl-CoA:carnitine CoA-transferase CaiB-like acyl-CoA transferase
VQALAARAGTPALAALDGAALLGEHAAVFGHVRRGRVSPGGSCRLLRAADRWIAVNLARADDIALLPAWLGDGGPRDPWAFVEARVAGRPAEEVVARARLLGLPAAVAIAPEPAAPPWLRIAAQGPAAPRPAARAPLVVDLSSLWAGPLCGHLLRLAGARVVKVEGTRRPDGARAGPAAFFDLMNAGKQSVALDLACQDGRRALARLLGRADIVIEASRPRAVAQLGIDAEALVAARPGLIWLSLTGYGRREPFAGWVAFGDDAAAAAGLAVATGTEDAPVFCGDAIADPLAGVHAALAAFEAWRAGESRLLDVSLRDVVAHILGLAMPERRAALAHRGDAWEVAFAGERAAVAPPRARAPLGRARELGADTRYILAELGAATSA